MFVSNPEQHIGYSPFFVPGGMVWSEDSVKHVKIWYKLILRTVANVCYVKIGIAIQQNDTMPGVEEISVRNLLQLSHAD